MRSSFDLYFTPGNFCQQGARTFRPGQPRPSAFVYTLTLFRLLSKCCQLALKKLDNNVSYIFLQNVCSFQIHEIS